jgi:hypothetical protein
MSSFVLVFFLFFFSFGMTCLLFAFHFHSCSVLCHFRQTELCFAVCSLVLRLSCFYSVCYALADATWHLYIIFVNCDILVRNLYGTCWMVYFLFVYCTFVIFSFLCGYVFAGRPASVFWGDQVNFQATSLGPE